MIKVKCWFNVLGMWVRLNVKFEKELVIVSMVKGI